MKCGPWRRHRIATLIVLILLALGATVAQAAIPASERTVLLNLYTSTIGGTWTTSTNWNGPAGTECTWYGVTCNIGGTTVTAITLGGNNLTGTLPGDFNSLTNLSAFTVSQNHLTGTIPSLTGLTNLHIFVAWGNQLTGSIPALASLTNLTIFDIDNNQLTGSIPALTGLTNLFEFSVGGNQLTGSIPALTGLANLQAFNVGANQLTGSVSALTGLTNLAYFEVNNNQLTGSIPALTGLTNLTIFHVHNNQLTGSIPTLTGLTNLFSFFVDGNQLTGSIPALTGLTSLVYYFVNDNQLTGSIPALTGLTNLTYFGVSNNQLTGSIPALTGLTNLADFFVNNNQLTGSIPALTSLANLFSFRADFNQLTGSIPVLTGLTDLRFFLINDNQLTGSIPALTGLTYLFDFSVGANQLTGSIPALTGLTNLEYFGVSNNRLTGNVPSVPSPSTLVAGGSKLCPNFLNHAPDPAWDTATGQTPWYTNCDTGPARLIVPDGTALKQTFASYPETRWFAMTVEPGKTYVIEAVDTTGDLTADAIGTLGVFAPDGVSAPPEANVDCTASNGPRPPAVDLNSDGLRCILRTALPAAGMQENKRPVYVNVTRMDPALGGGAQFKIRAREATIYGRWLTNNFAYHVEVENTTGDAMCVEVARYPESGLTYTAGPGWAGSLASFTLTVPAFGAAKQAIPSGSLVGTDSAGTLRIGACGSPTNLLAAGLHVSTYAFDPVGNRYIYFFTTTANEGKTRSRW